MAFLECPTRNDISAYSYKIVLEQVTYTLNFSFNDRMNKWFVSIGDSIGVNIIDPVPMAVNWDLFGRFASASLPPGKFYPFDTSNTQTDPGRFDLGDRVKLLYLESA